MADSLPPAGPTASVVHTTRMTGRTLVDESLAGLLQRPIRTVLTMLGTLLGVGAFVAILGLTTTAGNQIDKQFDSLTASTVTVTDLGAPSATSDDAPVSFPASAVARIDGLDGVVAAGIAFVPPGAATVTTSPLLAAGQDSALPVEAVDVGTFAVTHAHLVTGRALDPYEISARVPVAVLGQTAARRLGIVAVTPQTLVFVNGVAYNVVGIAADFVRLPELAASVMIPTSVAEDQFGQPTTPGSRPTMTIETRLGAAQLIARQAAVRLRPDAPLLFKVTAPQDPTQLRGDVQTAVNSLFLVLAGITLLIGAVSIANMTLVSVMERTGEIGLRRALGARGRHVAAQFIVESTATGLLGGIIGTALGVLTIVITAVAHRWTAVIDPWTVPVAPAVGALVGALAGLYPAYRAARVAPAAALRR